MKAKKLIALILCVITAAILFSVMSFAADECTHPELRWETVLQTCTTEGIHKAYCTTCNAHVKEKDEIIPAHNYTTVYIGKEATCAEEGMKTVYCSWCRSLENKPIPVNPLNHKYGAWRVTSEATCNKTGEKVRVCERAGCLSEVKEEKAVIPVDATKHIAKNAEWEIEIEPTCFKDGVKKNVCKVCGNDFTEYLSAHYDYADTTKYTLVSETPGTCTKPSVKKYRCHANGCTFDVEGETNPEAHDFTDKTKWVYTEGADCCNPGKLIKHCRYSYTHTTEETYAPHDFSGEVTVTEATVCGGKTLTTVKCANKDADGKGCTVTEKTETAVEHVWADWAITTGSCTAGGTATRECTCGATKEENVPFKAGTHLNYTVVVDDKPDCENIGWQIIKCTICDTTDEYFPEGNDPLGHNPGPWTITEEATCERAGKQQRVCLRCDKVVETSIITQVPHSFIILEAGVDATCTTAGITPYRYCIHCAETFVQEPILPLGHNFVDQSSPDENGVRICDRCYEYQVGEGEVSTCKCLCHNSNGLAKTVFKFVNFIYRLFGIKQECNCGAIHYEAGSSIFQGIFTK